MEIRCIAITQPEIKINGEVPTPEALIAWCARVSSAKQDKLDYKKLLTYCIRNHHWSVFEQVDMTVEIITTRGIAPQILRHRSFCFQEFSLRYSSTTEFEAYQARRQDLKNRQNSINDIPAGDQDWWQEVQATVNEVTSNYYNQALERSIAKESARNILPMGTVTKLYMKGSVRSWIHYFAVRCSDATQLEHRNIALSIRDGIFAEKFPLIHSVVREQEELNLAKDQLLSSLGLTTLEDINNYTQHLCDR